MTPLASRLLVVMVFAVTTATLLGAQTLHTVSFQGDELESFLQNAEVTDLEGTEEGVTRPKKATLELDSRTHFALFKTIDVFRPGFTRMRNGVIEVDFQDSWKTDVAAYELDKMIGLGMVPTTVERRHRGDRGSMQWWVDNTMSELDRVEDGIAPPDPQAWSEMVYKMRLFDSLIYNVDRQTRNMLVTEDWRIVLIDHSRSFRTTAELRKPDQMTRFSKSLLENIAKLDEEALKERLGNYLTVYQIRAILERRDLILGHAKELVRQRGEERVLFP
jgi:hypothetical protein